MKSLTLLFLVCPNYESIDNTNGTAYFVFRMVKTSAISHKRYKLL